MKKQFDIFLLSLLWLAASALGASFWFNNRFGFDIFSVKHWDYLGRMQAASVGIDSKFYLSMVVTVIVVIGGLYIIAQPRRRKINMQQPEDKIYTPNSNIAISVPEPGPQIPQVTLPQRPPRLIVPNIHEYNNPSAPNVTTMPSTIPVPPAPATTAPAATPRFTPATPPDDNFQEVEKIFENAGFVVKKSPRITGMRPALFAIGANETLWIGAIGTDAARLTGMVSALNNIFTETLEDIKINIHAFLLNPPAGDSGDDASILRFDTLNDLREYMNNNKNEEIPDSDQEDFDAYSEYIDTVLDYFNKQ